MLRKNPIFLQLEKSNWFNVREAAKESWKGGMFYVYFLRLFDNVAAPVISTIQSFYQFNTEYYSQFSLQFFCFLFNV